LPYRQMRIGFGLQLLILTLPAAAAERRFDFSLLATNKSPPGFRSAVTGQGSTGDWRIIVDEPQSSSTNGTAWAGNGIGKAVLAQLAEDPTDEHFPLLIFEDEIYGDFKVTTRFKTVRGKQEQMAGIAFRIQNETNYYVARASSLGSTFRLYKVVNGERGELH